MSQVQLKPIRILGLAVMVQLSANCSAFTWGINNDDVETYKSQAKIEEYKSLLNNPDLCEVLSDEGCLAISQIPKFNIQEKNLDRRDYMILGDLMSLTPEKSEEGMAKILGEPRKLILRNSALSLGVQVGISVESARYNVLWNKYSEVLDRGVNFTPLLIDDGTGRNILPPVVLSLGDSRQIGSGGRVFRIADQVYRVVKQPVFVLEPPTWRSYLTMDVPKPSIPPSSILPITEEEVEYWRVHLVRGYVKGVEVTHNRVDAKYRRLGRDYTGMVLYHLMRDLNMVTAPIISITNNPVISTHNGNMMAVNDSIVVLSVEPKLNSIRSNWQAYPQLKKFNKLSQSNTWVDWGKSYDR
ncbi:MAG: type IV secretory system conjugative DNA transfer family protein [Colwellia sp.]